MLRSQKLWKFSYLKMFLNILSKTQCRYFVLLPCAGDQRKTKRLQRVGLIALYKWRQNDRVVGNPNNQCRYKEGFKKGKPASFISLSKSQSTVEKVVNGLKSLLP